MTDIPPISKKSPSSRKNAPGQSAQQRVTYDLKNPVALSRHALLDHDVVEFIKANANSCSKSIHLQTVLRCFTNNETDPIALREALEAIKEKDRSTIIMIFPKDKQEEVAEFLDTLTKEITRRLDFFTQNTQDKLHIQDYKLSRTDAVIKLLESHENKQQFSKTIELLKKRRDSISTLKDTSTLSMGQKAPSKLRNFLSFFFSLIQSHASHKRTLKKALKHFLKTGKPENYELPLSDHFMLEETLLHTVLATSFKKARIQMHSKDKQEEALLKVLESNPNWRPFSKTIKYIDFSYKNSYTPYLNKGKGVTALNRKTTHLANAWLSTCSYTGKHSILRPLKYIRMGALSAFGIKDKAIRLKANTNRASELKSMIDGHFMDVKSITNISLMTPDMLRHGDLNNERLYTREHQDALNGISGVEHLNFSFAVNQGGLLGIRAISGYYGFVDTENKRSMKLLDAMVKNYNGKQPVKELYNQVKQIWDSKSYRSEGLDPYKIVSRLTLLTQMLEGNVTTINCKTGKDRTSQLENEVKYLYMIYTSTGIFPNPYQAKLSKNLMRTITTQSGNLEIQKLNTGVPGYKLKGVKSLIDNIGGSAFKAGFYGKSSFVKS